MCLFCGVEDCCLILWDKLCDATCRLGCNLLCCRYRWCPGYAICNEDDQEDQEDSSKSEEEKKRIKKEKNMRYNRDLETMVYLLILLGFFYMAVMPLVISYYWIDLFGIFENSSSPSRKYPLLEIYSSLGTQNFEHLNFSNASWVFWMYYLCWFLSYASYEYCKRSNPGRIFVEGDEKRIGYISRKDAIQVDTSNEECKSHSCKTTHEDYNSQTNDNSPTSATKSQYTLRKREGKKISQDDDEKDNDTPSTNASQDTATISTTPTNNTESEKSEASNASKPPLQPELPIRSKFCSRCGHRTAKYDHHCLWISNCVGEKNQLVFILFLIAMIIQTAICLCLVLYLFYLCIHEVTHSFNLAYELESKKRTAIMYGKTVAELWRDARSLELQEFLRNFDPILKVSTVFFFLLNLGNFCLSGLIFAFVTFMTGVQIYMISNNKTSVEYFSPEKYQYTPPSTSKESTTCLSSWKLFISQVSKPSHQFMTY
ncbi:hypothetical protein FDP41_012704 [Naegleria fowleri]|uniref:Palmitoyltransferase n=1 Tax=Naegleria fowleri TaxID=5763 RepID=A0A6A5BZT2_NAEFO|nr:uncharacterized protein FDP41_012704 [Naegleria fowleri]KAF0980916.1 hypothetical protein FDP41_012704 [Naegleria fowleri]CAG4712850.1 unnamed protein product [Naegleria fowleri]